MIRLIIWLLLIYIGYRIVMNLGSGKKPSAANHGNTMDAAMTYRDPVCGMYVSEDDAVIGRLDGQRHYFCSMACLEKYREQLDHTAT
ncbi:MAG: transcriptional regulator [Geobacteraceae bacterium]|nr:transcriptional regulator [Geobacteraceae bacterium]